MSILGSVLTIWLNLLPFTLVARFGFLQLADALAQWYTVLARTVRAKFEGEDPHATMAWLFFAPFGQDNE